jgi:hypothetical protein
MISDVWIDVPWERGTWRRAGRQEVQKIGAALGSVMRIGVRSGEYSGLQIARTLIESARRGAMGYSVRHRMRRALAA